MGKAAFDAKLSAIDALRSAEPVDRDKALAKALGDRNNFLVARAARVAGDVLAQAVIPNLLSAFDRFMQEASKSDPQCWAKTAIAKTLAAMEHQDPDVYLRGIRHIQLEAVWGGQEDTAAGLRAQCIIGLMDCRGIRDVDVLEHLIAPLYDADKNVRVEAARALGRMDRRESALVLRTRAFAGDEEPEPLGAVYSALLAIDGKRAIPFIEQFLNQSGDAAQEAALALGATHDPDALAVLRSRLRGMLPPDLRTTLMAAIALTRLPEAIDFLIEQVEGGSREAAQALSEIPLSDAERTRLELAR
jgi:HEAT repeat protein